MSEKTSQTSSESATSETAHQLTQVFQRIYDGYQGLLENEEKISDVKTVIKGFIDAQILEERAERNIDPLFDARGSAFVEHNEICQFLRPQHRRELKKIGEWLEATVTEKLKNEGFVVSRIGIPGVYPEVETLTEEVQKEITESHRIGEYTVNHKEIPDFLKEISVILSRLGFDRLSVETVREGELYNITAFAILIRWQSAIALLRFGKLAAQKPL